MEKVIIIKNLHKNYQVGKKEKNFVLRDAIVNIITFPIRLLKNNDWKKAKYFAAINGIDLSINKGEVVGIIGKNGAGKSTLLKVLSRITEPSCGEIKIIGKLGSLIEVGTGFHQELTGRENIYLNGAILGMKKKEVESRFKEIVDFSGIEEYLDLPVKKYSSGMYVRLAFAVAAHLDTDILLVDEVLSVGDNEFQQKSLGKVKDIASSGRTVIFVSHNLSSISQLCSRCILMSKGKITFDGKPKDAISKYLSSEYKYFGKRAYKKNKDKVVQIREVTISNDNHKSSGIIDIEKPIIIKVKYDVNQKILNSLIYINIDSIDGALVLKSTDIDRKLLEKQIGTYESEIDISKHLLNIGKYTLSAGCEIADKYSNSNEVFDHIEAFQFECVSSKGLSDNYGTGIIAPVYKWSTSKVR